MKKYDLGTIKIETETNGFPKGLILKREIAIRECRHIMKHLLGIDIKTREDCFDTEEYKSFNKELKNDVNDWLIGNADDERIMEYAYDCMDESIGIMNLIPILSYLKKIDAID